ncbi:MAG: hypothetical protein LQ344_004988 [Seirophora lacunosa]|nr:MAG: hypothetical protein LQ344_004988 [Seirophora lacunosa]
MHEILTLQLGHRANYLATHFWNTQESYFNYDPASEPSRIDHDIHFRAGKGPGGEDTYTPRTLIYDLKGGFGNLRKWGGLYDQGDVEEDLKTLWNGSVVKQKDAPITQSRYQRALDEGLEKVPKLSSQDVRYWSDFAHVFHHPRSIVQINDYELGSTILPFEKWSSGEDLFSSLDKEHDLLDRDVRPWAEECDQMQGIQIFAGADDAWGGFSSRYVEALRDEYGKTSLWFWGLEEAGGRDQRTKASLRTVNVAQSLQAISTLVSMYIPMALSSTLPPYVQMDQNSPWHISGLLSMALETITLPSRQKPGNTNRGLLSDIEAALNVNGNQKIADLQCSVIVDPSVQQTKRESIAEAVTDSRLPPSDSQGLVGYEDEMEKGHSTLDMDFSSGKSSLTALSLRQWDKANHIFGQVESIRGLLTSEQEIDEEDQATSGKRRRLASLPNVEKYYDPLPYPLLDSFPEILLTKTEGVTKTVVVHGSLSTTTQMCKRTEGLRNLVLRMSKVADRESLSNALGEIAEAYKEGWDSGSDEDSD